ncbi:MAG: ATP-binding protein [Pseudomonadota bacterium]
MKFNRILSLPELLAKKSFFLIGPRATGKSYLIREQLTNKALIINLLNSSFYLRLLNNPSELESIIEAQDKKIIVIDEIQRVPDLLNEVHRMIEEKNLIFLLTGSSVRRLKGDSVNLLAGRAWQANLFPLTSQEIENFNLDRYLLYGGLPAIYNSDYPEEELYAYVKTYLGEEIQAESLVRKIPAFSRFLKVSALTSGEILNFTSIASDAAISASTIREYYHILEDTLIGFMLPAWKKSIKRKAISAAKFYYFDIGIKNTLAEIKNIDQNSNLYGQAFEHFIILEVRAYLSYRRIKKSLYYWRSKHGHEVDLIIEEDVAIEIKSTKQISDKHLKNLCYLAEENIIKRYIILSNDPINRRVGNIEIINWQSFIKMLWADTILSF